ncbi:hypothetical protein GEV33_013737 [Tenebrio molitor]|uniref:Uncharacterized protein n=1 Tax=Tenebrio molitor TaxID=7067 RepID=A0A8J6H6P2_TENMO|nr:hypothetical protein GEV33_013737 [Tenebrio molitor]
MSSALLARALITYSAIKTDDEDRFEEATKAAKTKPSVTKGCRKLTVQSSVQNRNRHCGEMRRICAKRGQDGQRLPARTGTGSSRKNIPAAKPHGEEIVHPYCLSTQPLLKRQSRPRQHFHQLHSVSAKPGSLLFSSSDEFANFASTYSPEHRNSGSHGTHARSISCSKNVRLDEQNATTVMRVVEREGLGNDERSKECSQGTSSTIVIYEPSARRHERTSDAGASASFARLCKFEVFRLLCLKSLQIRAVVAPPVDVISTTTFLIVQILPNDLGSWFWHPHSYFPLLVKFFRSKTLNFLKKRSFRNLGVASPDPLFLQVSVRPDHILKRAIASQECSAGYSPCAVRRRVGGEGPLGIAASGLAAPRRRRRFPRRKHHQFEGLIPARRESVRARHPNTDLSQTGPTPSGTTIPRHR